VAGGGRLVRAVTFAAPEWLLAALVLPLLWWLSMPPRPRQQQWTPHLLQWQQALHALRRRPPRFATLRFLLLALAAAALVLAMAAPQRPGTPGAERLVVLLDGSASMAAHDRSGESAWQRACSTLRERLATVPAGVDVTLLVPGADLRRRHGASARALHDLPSPAGALAVDLPAVAASAAALPGTAVWTLTDGQGQPSLPNDGALSVFAAAGPNGAIVAVRSEDRWPLPELRVSVDVVAFAAAEVAAELQVAGAIAPLPAPVLVRLRPGERTTVPFELSRTALGGELVLTLVVPGDVLPGDDRWRLGLPPLPAPRIAVRSDADAGPFASVAATALAAEVGGAVVAAGAAQAVGLLLVDGGRIELEPGAQRAMTFGTRLGAGNAGGDATASEPIGMQPAGLDWDRQLPLCAGLDLSELRVQQAWPELLPPGEVFLWSEQFGERVPLGVVAGTDQLASVHLAFRLGDSNLPLLAAFPQLLRRAFVRCYGAGARLVERTAPPPPAELDLLAPASAADRPLPPFATAAEDLAPWCLLAALLALALRAFVR
jgi:hypothetical protein